MAEATTGTEGTGGGISSHRAVNQKWQCLAPRRFLFYSSLYGSLSKQTVLLLIMKEVTLLIYLPTQMQDVIEQNKSLPFTHQMLVALGSGCVLLASGVWLTQSLAGCLGSCAMRINEVLRGTILWVHGWS